MRFEAPSFYSIVNFSFLSIRACKAHVLKSALAANLVINEIGGLGNRDYQHRSHEVV